MPIYSQATALSCRLQTVDLRINQALDRRSKRDFATWTRKRRTLAGRLQDLLLTVATA